MDEEDLHRSQLRSQHAWKHKQKPRDWWYSHLWLVWSKGNNIFLPSLWFPLNLHRFKPSFCCLQSKVLANAFVSKGDKSTDLIYSFGNKKEFLLFGENTKLQRNSAYCWLLELAVEERMVSSEPTIVKIRILIEGQQGSTLWHRVCLCGMYWDKNGTQSPSCVKGRISYPSSVGLHDFPCRARRLRKGMLQDATAHGYPLRMHGGGWMGGR